MGEATVVFLSVSQQQAVHFGNAYLPRVTRLSVVSDAQERNAKFCL